MDLFICDEDDRVPFQLELSRAFPTARWEERRDGLIAVKGIPPQVETSLVFPRQLLPEARFVAATSIKGWIQLLYEAGIAALPEHLPWRLHVLPWYGGDSAAGRLRGRLIQEGLLEVLHRRRRQLLRRRVEGHALFTPEDSLVQLLLTSPDRGFLSIASAPVPFRMQHVITPFSAGELPEARDQAAPSRAFAKLLEAEVRLGRAIGAGETCVDLGACPGSWSYAALARGAQVLAVDRAPLRDDLMRHPQLTFHRGDAFLFEPVAPVDWLLCDVIAAPDRTLGLLGNWLERRWCRHFVVTIKFKGVHEYARVEPLKKVLRERCEHFILKRLCANRNEVCAAGRDVLGG